MRGPEAADFSEANLTSPESFQRRGRGRGGSTASKTKCFCRRGGLVAKMAQTTLSVVLEVAPESSVQLSNLIEQVKRDEETWGLGVTESYQRLKWGVPTLHFMSMSVFQDAHYDPIFVIEANFDGEPGPFWAQLEATYSLYLRPMLRCCKRPADSGGPLYDAVTARNSRYPIAPYLERKTLWPSAFHHGNRGLTRDRILREAELFEATRIELAQVDPTRPNPYCEMTAEEIHQKLRGAMLAKFSWLAEPTPARISARERARDLFRVLGFLLLVIFVLSIPGYLLLVLLPLVFPGRDYTLLALVLIFLLIAIPLYFTAGARLGEAAPARSGGFSLSFKRKITSLGNPLTAITLGIVVTGVILATASLIGAWLLDLFTSDPSFSFRFLQYFKPIFCVLSVGVLSMFLVSIPAILGCLRWLERRDSHHDAPDIDQRELRKMTKREDWIPQNHMGSVVLVKPGVLRMALFRAGHRGLGLIVRLLKTDGYLGSMRTIHFAHWAFVNNGSRLLFFSNFDHSWDSYLDDFIEKAHAGLTLAWSSGIGFPATRFLFMDGASHGRQFKAWARHSMAVSRFWFSAYRELTVNQIERQARIAAGLRKAELTPKEAAEWACDL